MIPVDTFFSAKELKTLLTKIRKKYTHHSIDEIKTALSTGYWMAQQSYIKYYGSNKPQKTFHLFLYRSVLKELKFQRKGYVDYKPLPDNIQSKNYLVLEILDLINSGPFSKNEKDVLIARHILGEPLGECLRKFSVKQNQIRNCYRILSRSV